MIRGKRIHTGSPLPGGGIVAWHLGHDRLMGHVLQLLGCTCLSIFGPLVSVLLVRIPTNRRRFNQDYTVSKIASASH